MQKTIHFLSGNIGRFLMACLLLCVLTGCASKPSILKPYDPMDLSAGSEASPTIDKAALKRLDGVSGNTLLIKDDSAYDSSRISARQALLVNITSGEVLLSKQALTAIPAGNFTKLFAAYVVLNNEENPERQISISQDTYNLRSDLVRCKFQKNDVFTVNDLLYASLMYCANDAVIALSSSRPGGSISAFVSEMNALSDRLNLKSSGFTNAYGYPSGEGKQETTLLDVYTILREMIDNYPAFSEIISKPVYYCTYMNSKNEPVSTSWASSLPYYNTEVGYDMPEHLELLGGICEPASTIPSQIFCLFKDAYGTQYLAILAGCNSYDDCYEQMQNLAGYIPSIY